MKLKVGDEQVLLVNTRSVPAPNIFTASPPRHFLIYDNL